MLMVGVRLVNPLEEMTSFSLLLETPAKVVWLSTLLPAQVSDVGSPEGGAPHRLYYDSAADGIGWTSIFGGSAIY
jgi:hypothetical protein